MTTRRKRRPIDYLLPAIVLLFMAAILLTSRWRTADRYSEPAQFAGCYRDAAGSLLELERRGAIRSGGIVVGTFKIVSPVGGKHGYLVEASNLHMSVQGGKVVAQPGSGGFLWPISENGELLVTFAPSTISAFRRGACQS